MHTHDKFSHETDKGLICKCMQCALDRSARVEQVAAATQPELWARVIINEARGYELVERAQASLSEAKADKRELLQHVQDRLENPNDP